MAEVDVGHVPEAQVAFDHLDQIEALGTAKSVEQQHKRRHHVIADEQQRERPHWNGHSDPADAVGTRVVELRGEHGELVLVAQTSHQLQVAATYRIGGGHPVIEDRDSTHSIRRRR